MMAAVTAPPEGPVPSLERRMMDAYRAGEAAARDHTGNRNPHSGTADAASERVLSILWRKGYRRVVDERLPAGFPRSPRHH